jgi:hypothetical protein
MTTTELKAKQDEGVWKLVRRTGAEEHPTGTDGFPYGTQHDEAPFPVHCYRRTFALRYLGLPPSPANNSPTLPIFLSAQRAA